MPTDGFKQLLPLNMERDTLWFPYSVVRYNIEIWCLYSTPKFGHKPVY